MLRFLRRLWPFRRGAPLVEPGVRVVEEDAAVREIPAYPFAVGLVVGPAVGGPVGGPVYIGPSIARPRWWQPWRWYLQPRYRQECREALAKFHEVFGRPADGRLPE